MVPEKSIEIGSGVPWDCFRIERRYKAPDSRGPAPPPAVFPWDLLGITSRVLRVRTVYVDEPPPLPFVP